MNEFSKCFTGIALEISPAPAFREISASSKIHISSLWSGINGAGLAVAQVLVLSVILQAITLAMPFQLQLIVDQAIANRDQGLLVAIGVGFGGLVVFRGITEFTRGWAIQIFGGQITFQIVGNLVRHLLHLPTDYFQKRSVGDVASRVASGGRIHDVLTHGVISGVVDGVASILSLAFMLIYSRDLTLIMCALVAVQIIGVQLFLPALKRRQEAEIRELATEQNFLMETVRAVSTIKVLGGEAAREARWRNLFANVINASNAAGKWSLGLNAWNSLLTGIQVVVIGSVSASLVIRTEDFTVGMLFAFMAMRQLFADRVSSLLTEFTKVRLLRVHLDRVADIVLTPRQSYEVSEIKFGELSGSISFEGVSYRYGETDKPVLENINFTIQPGEFIAITGRTGGGKSTLLRLMLGLSEPAAGTIKLDGVIAQPSLWRNWRECVGVVMQDDQLLSGTLADNISFFDPEIDMDLVRQAAATAQIDTDINAMPMKYFTFVGDMGSTLSGGQKQRVLLARALYRKPKILFLDEGTANLDIRTERVIAQALDEMQITRIVIAHRRALVEKANRVFVMQDGRLFPHKTLAAEVD